VLRKTLVGLAVLAAAASTGVGTAMAAGQVGQGNGRSICRFSGLNDNPDDPVEGGRVQSFGQIVRHMGPLGGVPGTDCNPNTGADLHPVK
jgi:hypothetical protein